MGHSVDGDPSAESHPFVNIPRAPTDGQTLESQKFTYSLMSAY